MTRNYLQSGDVLIATQHEDTRGYKGTGWAVDGPMTVDGVKAFLSGFDAFINIRRIQKIEADGVITDETDRWAELIARDLYAADFDDPSYAWLREAGERLLADGREIEREAAYQRRQHEREAV